MSWGSIYGETWWGSQNAINFNEISYYIYAVDQLKTRALDDGAIMEGFGSFSSFFSLLARMHITMQSPVKRPTKTDTPPGGEKKEI